MRWLPAIGRWWPLRTVRRRVTTVAVVVVSAALAALAASLLVVLHATIEDGREDFAEGRAEDIARLVADAPLVNASLVTGDRYTVAQVVDADGRIVASSTPALATMRIADLSGDDGDRGVTVERLPAGPAGRHRVVAVDADGPNGPLEVYVATSLEPADHAVKVWAIRLARRAAARRRPRRDDHVVGHGAGARPGRGDARRAGLDRRR